MDSKRATAKCIATVLIRRLCWISCKYDQYFNVFELQLRYFPMVVFM